MRQIKGTSSQTAPEGLSLWVIYDHPSDYPNHYVVRRWVGSFPDEECGLFERLADARRHVPPGSVKIEPADNDDPKILEIWL
jgi:hypothetical protein